MVNFSYLVLKYRSSVAAYSRCLDVASALLGQEKRPHSSVQFSMECLAHSYIYSITQASITQQELEVSQVIKRLCKSPFPNAFMQKSRRTKLQQVASFLSTGLLFPKHDLQVLQVIVDDIYRNFLPKSPEKNLAAIYVFIISSLAAGFDLTTVLNQLRSSMLIDETRYHTLLVSLDDILLFFDEYAHSSVDELYMGIKKRAGCEPAQMEIEYKFFFILLLLQRPYQDIEDAMQQMRHFSFVEYALYAIYGSIYGFINPNGLSVWLPETPPKLLDLADDIYQLSHSVSLDDLTVLAKKYSVKLN